MYLQVRNDHPVRNAVKAAKSAGITRVAAAGNTGKNDIVSTDRAPARYRDVITVAASSEQYQMYYKSSYGSSVDIIALGAGIWSDWYTMTRTCQ